MNLIVTGTSPHRPETVGAVRKQSTPGIDTFLMKGNMMKYCYMDSPVGSLLLAGNDSSLAFIGFPQGKGQVTLADNWSRDEDCFGEVKTQLDAYFSGSRKAFSLNLAPSGTEFQLQVWHALQSIPYGETRSYRDIAESIGKPLAVRAVGAANAKNHLPIVVPCHRVIGANGNLTGFGGGLETKAWLLDLESGKHKAAQH